MNGSFIYIYIYIKWMIRSYQEMLLWKKKDKTTTIYLTIWTNFKIIMLSERRQTRRSIYSIILFPCNSRKCEPICKDRKWIRDRRKRRVGFPPPYWYIDMLKLTMANLFSTCSLLYANWIFIKLFKMFKWYLFAYGEIQFLFSPTNSMHYGNKV